MIPTLDADTLYGVYRYEGIPVPIPDAGIPLEVVEEARRRVKSNVSTPSKNGHRFWELSGGILFCEECKRRMDTHSPHAKAGYFYYRCKCLAAGRADPCTMRELVRADSIEPKVWAAVSRLLDDKEHVLTKTEAHFAQQRTELQRSGADLGTLAKRLDDIGHMRRRFSYQEAEGAISMDDLKARNAELDNERDTLQRELDRVRNRDSELERLDLQEQEIRERILATDNNLDGYSPEQRRQLYQDLHMRVEVGLEKVPRISGVFPLRKTAATDGKHTVYIHKPMPLDGVSRKEKFGQKSTSLKPRFLSPTGVFHIL